RQLERSKRLGRLGGLGVLRGVEEGGRGGGEDPWLCGPGFRRVCLFSGVWGYGRDGYTTRQARPVAKAEAVLTAPTPIQPSPGAPPPDGSARRPRPPPAHPACARCSSTGCRRPWR